MQNTLLYIYSKLIMTQSVLNTFKILNEDVKLRAFNLLKYDIRSFLNHDLN